MKLLKFCCCLKQLLVPSFFIKKGRCDISINTVVVVALHYYAWTFIMDIMAD